MAGTAIGLLAPVPEEHLLEGLITSEAAGKVAYGSRDWQVFCDLDAARKGEPVEVFIYASGSTKLGPPKVRWRALYVGHVESKAGAHPDGTKFRPASTLKYESDNQGHWAVFWEVVKLQQLNKAEAISMDRFRGWQSRKYYVSTFVPEGPLLVEAI